MKNFAVNFFYWIGITFFISLGNLSYSQPLCKATVNNPCLVQDTTVENKPLIKNLRSTLMISQYYSGNTQGVDKLFISASAQPSEAGWHEAVNYITHQYNVPLDHIQAVDLRQESHGYLNNQAITLCSQNNWINLGKSKEEVLKSEAQWLAGLALMPDVGNVLSADQFHKHHLTHGKLLPVNSVHSEKELTALMGLNYVRFTIPDHQAPNDEEVNAIVDFISNLSDKNWLHVHCRGGKGRTVTFLAMYDMLKNADKVSFDEIITRQASIPPFYNLSHISPKKPEFTAYYQARFVFLNEFNQYAQQRLAGEKISWSEWKSNKKA